MEPTEIAPGPTREELMASLNRKLRSEQNLPLGLAAGAGAALAGSLLWMAIAVLLQMQIGIVALAVGAGIGYSVRYAGRGVSKVFGVTGAFFTFLACLGGEALAHIQLVATSDQVGFFQALSQVNPGFLIPDLLEHASPITWLIYGIGIYEGYKLSFRKLTPQEIEQAGFAPVRPPP